MATHNFDPRTYNVTITSDGGSDMLVECGPNRTRPDVAILVMMKDGWRDVTHRITDTEWQRALVAADKRDAR